jgi:hypothetical protein
MRTSEHANVSVRHTCLSKSPCLSIFSTVVFPRIGIHNNLEYVPQTETISQFVCRIQVVGKCTTKNKLIAQRLLFSEFERRMKCRQLVQYFWISIFVASGYI